MITINKQIIIFLTIAIFIGGASFYGGMKYQQLKSRGNIMMSGNQLKQGQGNGGFGQFRNRQNGDSRPVIGEVIESDDNSITVKLDDGSSKIVLLTNSTTISKSSDGVKSDIKNGERILVVGSNNSDGSVSAQKIQLNPQMRVMRTTTQTPTIEDNN